MDAARRGAGPAARRRAEGVQKIWAIAAGVALPTPRVGRERPGLHGPGTALGAGLDAHLWVLPKLGTAASAAWEVILGCKFYLGWRGCIS